jgi:hypothetical protein
MNFNGTSLFVGPNVNTTSNLTVFAVVMMSGNSANNSRIVSLATPTKVDYDTFAEALALQQPSNTTAIGTGRNTASPTGGTGTFITSTDDSTTSNVPYIAVARYSASLTQTLFINGSAKATGATTGAFGYTTYGIGNYANAPSASEPFVGKISEVLIYSNALTPVQRAQVENYLYQKWAINVSSTALTHAIPYDTCNVTANYTQIGNYISYMVTTPADGTGATDAGRWYIYSVVPSWNGTNGNTVTTDTESQIRLYKPTTPGGLGATGQGNSFTLNWQSAVIWTSPTSTIIPSYFLQVAPNVVSATYPPQSFNVIGNTQTVNGFDSSAGALSISLTAITPLGYINPIYGNPATLTFTVPSGNTVSITQSTTNAETLIVTVPVRSGTAQYTWFFITGTGQGGQRTAEVSNFQGYKTNSSNYDVNVSLGYNYTISAFLTTTTSPPTPADPSAPANPNPFPAKTLNVSGITVTHDACTVTLTWLAVTGAEKYYVQTNNNGQPASGKFGQEYTTTTAVITNNGASEQFAPNEKYSYIVRAFTLSTNQFQGSLVRSCNILSEIATSSNVTMYIPTNPTATQLTLTQSFANIITSWPELTSYPQDNLADIGTPSYTISCQTFASSVTTTGTTATFGEITPGTSYLITLNTRYKGFWGATPTTTTFQTTSAAITSGPTLTSTGTAEIRVTASAAAVGFWYLLSGNIETLMNSPANAASNQITSNFSAERATTYTRQVKFVRQDTGLSVTSSPVSVSTPNLTLSIPSLTDTGLTDRKFSISLGFTGTASGAFSWVVGTPTGTTLSAGGSTTTNPTTLTYQFTNAAWSTNLSATFTSIVLSNNGFTFSYTGANPTFTPPNLAITGITLLNENSAGNLILRATNACNVTWTYPSYSTLGGGGSSTTTALSVNYGAISATGTTYSPSAALTLVFNGYTNLTSLPSFTAPTFSVGTVTFADPNNGTKIIRLTANYPTFIPGTTGGTTTPRWTFPLTTSNGGGYTELTTTGTLDPNTSPATLDYATISSAKSYAIAANAIRLSYQGISISYGSLLTASTPNISLTLSGTYSGTTITVNATNASGVVGNWSLGTITPSVLTPTQTPANPTAAPTFTIPGAVAGNTYTIPVNFNYNNGQFTSTSSASVFIPTPLGRAQITGATFLYFNANSTDPNGFNVTYTPDGFTPSVSTPAAVGCTTPVTLHQNYDNFSAILVTDSTNNANVQKGDLNANVIYRANATESRNGVLGPLSTRNVVMPGFVTDVRWGSGTTPSTAGDNGLATLSSIWISWSPISPASSISSRFTYTLYSNTGVVNRPSTTSPTGAVTGYTGLPVTTSNVQFTITASGSQTYFIGTTYTDPSGYSYYSAASSQIKFTYSSCNIPATGAGGPQTTFTEVGAKTYVLANLGAGNGGVGGAFESSFGSFYTAVFGNGLGGLGASWIYDGSATNILKSGYTILFVPGYNGYDGDDFIAESTDSGLGGSGYINGSRGTRIDPQYLQNTEIRRGGGGGGAARIWIRNPAADNATILLIDLGGGGGGGGYYGAGGGGGGTDNYAPPYDYPQYGGLGGGFNGEAGNNGSVRSGSTTGIGTVGNARPETSTCDIYYIVPG